MSKARIVVGGAVAALINFFLDGALHGVLLRPDWMQIAAALHLKGDPDATPLFGYYIAYDLLKGLLSTLLYALIRPRLAPGLRTALVAGLIVWALVLPVPILGLLPQGFFTNRFGILWALCGAAPVLLGAVAGAALYKEEP